VYPYKRAYDCECRFSGGGTSDASWLQSLTPVDSPALAPAALPTPPASIRSLPHPSASPPLPRSESPLVVAPAPRHASYRPASPAPSTHAPSQSVKVHELLAAVQDREAKIQTLEDESAEARRTLDQLRSGTSSSTFHTEPS
jgi:hypothetical protein